MGGSGAGRTIRLTPLLNQNGSATIKVTVKDTDGGTTVKSFQVKVTPVNDAPTITPPAAQSINEDIEISSAFEFTVDDIDNNRADLNVTATSGNTGLIPDTNIILGGSGATRSIKVIPTENNNGTAEITLRVSDGSLSATDKFVVTVDNVNDAPYIGTIADQEIDMNTQTQAIAFNVHDIDNDAAGLTLSYSSDNTDLIPNTDTNIVLGGSGGTRTVTVRPAADVYGTATVTVTVSDGELTASESFTVYVDGTGGGPSVISNIRDQVINEDTDTGYIYFSVDSAYTTVNVTAGDESIFPADNIEKGSAGTGDARTIWYTKLRPIENANGEAIITVSANNGTETENRTFKITVTPVNDLPVINGNPFIQMTEDGSTQENSSITVNDVDRDDLDVSVNATNLVLFPAGAVEAVGHGSSWTLSITPEKDRNGVSVITVTVYDGHETVKKNFTVNVAAENDAPTITGIAAQDIEEDSTLGPLSFDVGDVELTSDSLSVWATSSNQALVPDGNITIGGRGVTRTISLQPAVNANTEVKGTATITVHVSDGDLSAETSFLLTVAPVNDAPYINYIANQTILEDANIGDLAFTIGDIDTDTRNVTISATSSNTDLIPAAGISTGGTGSSRTICLTPVANAYGTTVITVRASDGVPGGTSSRTFTLNVVSVNDAPVVTVNSTINIDEDTSTETPVPFSISDVETPAASLALSVSSGNEILLPNSGIDLEGSGADWSMSLTPAANQNGVMLVPIKVSDGTATTIKNVTLVVNPINDKPTITAVADQTIDEDSAGVTLGFTVGDIETSAGSLVVTASSGNTSLVSPGNILLGGSGANRTIKLTPIAQQNGVAVITLNVYDGTDTTTETFKLNVTPVNDIPSFTGGGNQAVDEDSGMQTVTSWATDIYTGQPNESSQTVTFYVSNDNNPLFDIQPEIRPDGTLTYKPAANANGTSTVTVYMKDDGGTAHGGVDTTPSQTFTITVNAVNDAPSFTVGADQTFNEDCGAKSVSNWASGISRGPSDESGQTVNFVVSVSADPTLTFSSAPAISPAGVLTFTPAPNAYGTANVTVYIHDNGGTARNGKDSSASQSFVITINPVNDRPTFTKGANQSFPEDCGAKSISWATGISKGAPNESAQTLTFHVTNDNNGLFSAQPSITSTGTLTFTPAANANGTATVTVYLTDDGGVANGGVDTSTTQTFTITITAVNDTPIITETGPLEMTMSEDSSPTPFELTLHATDVENSILTWSISGAAAHGMAAVSSAPTGTSQAISYVPNANYNGTDSFVVDVTDGRDSATIIVNVIITPVNDAPVITQGEVATVTVNEDAGNTAVLTLGGTDADNDSLTWSISRAALHGTASVSSTPTGANQEISYIPDADYNGSDSFVVELSDSNGGIDTITVNVTVASINDVPVITESGPVAVTMSEDGIPTPFALTLHAVDVENSTLTWSISGAAIHGTASVSNAPSGTSQVISYIPNANYNGADSFVVSVTDGTASAAITVNVTITPVNDIPVTSDYDYTIRAGSIVKGRIAASDADGDALSYTLQTLPAEIKGNFTLNRTTGEWTFASLLNFAGTQGVRVQVADGQGGMALSTISFNIRALTISKEYIETTLKNTPVSSRVSMGNASSYTVSIQPLHGEVGLNNDGSYTYTPAAGYVGTDQFTVLASGGSEPALLLVRIVVNDVNLVLQGTVSRAMEPHSVIGGAQVKLLDLSGKVIKSAVTDENGKYRFTALAENNYKIVVTHPEYSENRRAVEIFQARATDGVITQNFNMAAFTISLSASPSSIKGDGHDTTLLTAVIKDVNGVPIKDVTLSFSAPLGTFDYTDKNTGTAVTGEDGAAGIHYTSADISASNTSIVVPVTVSVNDTEKGLFADESIFVTFAPGFVTGVVYDNTAHEHVKGAVVEVYKDFDDDGITDFSFTQTTGEDGAYNIAVPKAGVQYEIRITKPVTIGNTTQTVEYTQKATVESVDGQTFTSDLTAAGLVVAEQPDGSQSIVDDFSRLSFEVQDGNGTELGNIDGRLDTDAGIFHAERLEPDTDYVFVIKYQVAPGQELIVGKVSVNLNLDGEMSISHILIDPYGVVRDQDTGEVIKDAVVTLHYANTVRNEEKGTVVRLPELEAFPPNNNKNPQNTDAHGKYAFMVFPEADYYIVAEKPGYTTYTSPTIAVEHELVQHNFTMKKAPAGGGTGGSGGGGGGAGGSAGAATNAGVVTVPPAAAQPDDAVRDLAVTLNTSRMKVSEGSEVQLTIPFVNKSKIAIHDAVITAYIPGGLQAVSIGNGTADGRTIRWNRTDVKPGSRENLTFTLKADNIDGGEVMKEIRVEVTSKENLSLLDDDKSKIQLMVYSNRTSKIHHRYIKGTPDGKFKPESKLTRAETAAIFARLLNLESTVTSKKSLYSDVPGSHWANEYIIAVSQRGLMKGVGSGKFAPDSPISRAELATIIARYFGLERSSSIQPIELHFSDIGQNWARNSIEEIYRYSIIKGYNDGTFRPDSSITRAEAVACFNRMLYRGPIGNVGNVFPDVKQSFWAAGDIDEAYNSHEYIINPDGTEKVTRYIEEPLW